ncbi:MAG TPA: TIGR03118 family protein [Rhizomicrobium sp.]|nr:TIGR03118 family protein [Rhizomicrobium sp.]
MNMSLGLALSLALLSTTAIAGAPQSSYHVVDKVSNNAGNAPNVDRKLVNAWGIARFPGGALWVNGQGANKSMTYNVDTGNKLPTRVNVPGGPTGIAYIDPDPDGTGDFKVTRKHNSARSFMAFATTGGKVWGWNPDVAKHAAILGYDGTGGGDVFTGLAFAPHVRFLLAADFHGNRVININGDWSTNGSFTDPNLPEDYAPFGVSVVNGDVYVTFAKHDDEGEEIKGAGLGIVDVFNQQGKLKRRLISDGGALNAPWGVVQAPKDFGSFSGNLLIGNFGDGKVNAYDISTGAFLGTLSDAQGQPLVIDGLWGMVPRPSGAVTFASGPDDEQNGLVGTIELDR